MKAKTIELLIRTGIQVFDLIIEKIFTKKERKRETNEHGNTTQKN